MTHPVLSLSERLARIRAEQVDLLRQGPALLGVGRSLGAAGLLLLAAAKRSVALAEGFIAMIEARNFHAAAPMVRLQLDTALRIAALRFVTDPQAYAAAVMAGESVYKLRDDSGERLTDHRLLARLGETFPWITTVYHDASAFVHLSARHLWTSIDSLDHDEQIVRFVISAADPPSVDADRYIEAVDAFFHCLLLANGLVVGAIQLLGPSDDAPPP